MLFEDRLKELKSHIINQHPKHQDSPLSIDSLFDGIVAIYDDCKVFGNADKTGAISRFIQKCTDLKQKLETYFPDIDGPIVSNLRTLRINKEDFTYIRRLATGQFGEVLIPN
jgi:hypothetical protein